MKQYTREENAITLWRKTQPEGDCLVWMGARNDRGYGNVARGRQSRQYVHRLMWEQHYGPIPTNMCVCHTCDNPPCIKIEHLFLGTNQDNQLDAVSKGRRPNSVARRGVPLRPEHIAAIAEGKRKAKELRQEEGM